MGSLDNTSIPDGYKRCSKGDECVHPEGPILPETTEYFSPHKRYKNGLDSSCRKCRNAYDRSRPRDRKQQQHEYYLRVRKEKHEQWREKDRRYRQNNYPRIRARNKVYEQTHKDKVSKWGKASRQRHPDTQNKKAIRWREKNPQKYREVQALYRRRHPEKGHLHRARRRARLKNAEGDVTVEQLADLMKKAKGRCYYCKKKIVGTPHIDHAVPLARGGSNDIGNLVVACSHCNLSKGAKLPHEFSDRLL